MNRRSIRFRLTVWYTAIMAITFAAVGLGVWFAMRNSINGTVDRDLRSRLQAMRAFLAEQAPEGSVDELVENAALAPAGTRFRIADASGRWIYQSPGTEGWGALPRNVPHLPNRGVFETIMQNGEPIRVLSETVPPGVIQIGIPVGEFTEMLNTFNWTAWLATPLLLIVASAGGYWMSRRALAPVERIAHGAADIEAHNLSERPPSAGRATNWITCRQP